MYIVLAGKTRLSDKAAHLKHINKLEEYMTANAVIYVIKSLQCIFFLLLPFGAEMCLAAHLLTSPQTT